MPAGSEVPAATPSQELLDILGHMRVAVFRADRESRLLAVNAQGAQLLGASDPSELLGRRFAELVHYDTTSTYTG